MTLQIYTALAFLMVGFLVDPSNGLDGDFIAEKAHNKVIHLADYPNFQVKYAIAYGGAENHVEFQIVGEKDGDLITILIVAKTRKVLNAGAKGGSMTHNEAVYGDAPVACTAAKNGEVDPSFCEAALTALKSTNFLTAAQAQDYELKSTHQDVKKLGAKLREGTLAVGGSHWKIVTANTLDLTKTNQLPTLLFIGKKEFSESKHGLVLVLATFNTNTKKFTAKSAAFAANGVIVEAPTEQVIKDATDKTKITAALAKLLQ